MRPFRSRAMAAIVLAILLLGMLGSVANAAQISDRPNCFPEDPWPTLGHGRSFPEDPWPDAN
jgi:hypothetical protein